MAKTNTLTTRQIEYLNATRPVNDPRFPTQGFYFIRKICNIRFSDGDILPVAVVNWRPSTNPSFQDMEPGNRFYLRLDYLYGGERNIPSNVADELRHKIIEVRDAKLSLQVIRGEKVEKAYVEWEVQKEWSLDDQITYSNFYAPVMAEIDTQHQREQDLLEQQIYEWEMEDDEVDSIASEIDADDVNSTAIELDEIANDDCDDHFNDYEPSDDCLDDDIQDPNE